VLYSDVIVLLRRGEGSGDLIDNVARKAVLRQASVD
jgi:hypothetical protein